MYEYSAKILRVIDGDTVDASVDLGFGISMAMRFRLFGVDTPEVKGESKVAGLSAKKFVEDWLAVNPSVRIRTEKDKHEKYGRYLASIMRDEADITRNLSLDLLAAGLAKPYTGGAR